MVNAFPAVQVNVVDPSCNPQAPVFAQVGGVGLLCNSGVMLQDATLAPASSLVPLVFPLGITTAVFIYIAAAMTTDLKVNLGGTPLILSLPYKQGMLLYNISSSAITLSSVLGGQVQYAIGG